MEEITEQRAIAVTKLGELQKIKSKPYTALGLRGRRPMLGRVQRQEQLRYHQSIKERKAKLKKGIADIDLYLASVATHEEYLARLPKKDENEMGLMGTPSVVPIAPTVLSAPVIVFGKKPMLKETRLKRYERRGRRY